MVLGVGVGGTDGVTDISGDGVGVSVGKRTCVGVTVGVIVSFVSDVEKNRLMPKMTAPRINKPKIK